MYKIEYDFSVPKLRKPINQNKEYLQLSERDMKKLRSLKSFFISTYYAARNVLENENLQSALSKNCVLAIGLLEDIMFDAWEADYLSDSFIRDFSHGLIPSCSVDSDFQKTE